VSGVETEFAAKDHRSDNKAAETYGRHPCLHPEDIAAALLVLPAQTAHVQVHDVLMRPTRQPA
jgi:NADP-dependent 3-hydroxy acid dehydrogenase YdfG